MRNPNTAISLSNERADFLLAPFDCEEFSDNIATIRQLAPEVDNNFDALHERASELAICYQLKPEFFEHPDFAISLLLAAGLSLDAEKSEGKTEARISYEHALSAAFNNIAFEDYSPYCPRVPISEYRTISEDKITEIFRRFNNTRLSNQLRRWILQSQNLADYRLSNNVNESRLRDVEVLVVEASEEWLINEVNDLQSTPAEKEVYRNRMRDKAKAIKESLGWDREFPIPIGFCMINESGTTIWVQDIVARLLVEPERFSSSEGRNLHKWSEYFLCHELAHAFGDLGLQDSRREGVPLGLLLEEWRADVLSRDFDFDTEAPSSYPDVYNVDLYIKDIFGVGIKEIILSLPEGGASNKAVFYGQLIRTTNLSTAALLAAILPKHYLREDSYRSNMDFANIMDTSKLDDELYRRMSPEEFKEFLDLDNCTEEELALHREALLEIRTDAWVKGAF